MAKKRVFVTGGSYKKAPKYELCGELFVQKGFHFSTRAEWRRFLDQMFVFNGSNSCPTFRYYIGLTIHDAQPYVDDAGALHIGCNVFSRNKLKVIAKWAGWYSSKIKRYLPPKKREG